MYNGLVHISTCDQLDWWYRLMVMRRFVFEMPIYERIRFNGINGDNEKINNYDKMSIQYMAG